MSRSAAIAAISGIGSTDLSWHTLEHLEHEPGEHCSFEGAVARGDTRLDMTGPHPQAEKVRAARAAAAGSMNIRLYRALDEALIRVRRSLAGLLDRQQLKQ
jgi:hypothetical protein